MQHSTELTIQYSYYRQEHVAAVCVISETLCQSLHYIMTQGTTMSSNTGYTDCHVPHKITF